MTTSLANTLSPKNEMLAYEVLWATTSTSLKTIAEWFQDSKVRLPSELLRERRIANLFRDDELDELARSVASMVGNLSGFSVCIRGTCEYPVRLRDAKYPLELFYYRGDIGCLDSRCVSVVGARSCTPHGRKRAAQLAAGLVKEDFTIVSGLAKGIDTAAMKATIKAGGRTIGVIGTPLNECYPKENELLQEQVAKEHLLISQVPFYRYLKEPFKARRRYFPQRNETMAAISEATIIVEASDKSGSLTQARACMQQCRKLFILNSCFDRTDISWPHYYLDRGAIRVRTIDDVLSTLGKGR